ncbi:MAG: M23 family metallopeptidase [Gemmatimonadaceae bacterium]|nr:M23 family metallopeptidase [Gemmatimonadaceae bacterium]
MYSTKPETGALGITMARRGDTAIVIDTSVRSAVPGPGGLTTVPLDSALQSQLPASAGVPAAGPIAPTLSTPGVAGSSFPAVAPADIVALRAQSPVVPVAGIRADKLSDSFDDARGGSRRHNAMDIMAPRGTPVVAVTAGRILKLHNSVAGGMSVYATDASSRYLFLYGHLDKYRPGLVEGAAVTRGEVIGYVGSTGNANPLGPHLHFGITRSDNVKEWWKGTPLNPYLVFQGK